MEKKKIGLQQIKNKLLWRLTRRDHSVTELRTKLRLRNEFSEEDFSAALDWLRKFGYLPDETRMAQQLVQKYRNEGRGQNYIRVKLKQRGLELKSTDDGGPRLSDSEAEKAAALVFLGKKLRGRPLHDLSFEEVQALQRKMTTRGFSYETVRDLIREENKK